MNALQAEKLEKIAKAENCDGEFLYFDTARWGPICLALKQQPDGKWKGIWSMFGVAQVMMANSDWNREAFIGGLMGDASNFATRANDRDLIGGDRILNG